MVNVVRHVLAALVLALVIHWLVADEPWTGKLHTLWDLITRWL